MIRNRWLAGGFSLGLLGAVLWPIAQNWRATPRDDFPLSYYPMFSARRGKSAAVTHLLGLDAAGRRVPIAYALIGPGGFNQVRRQVRARVERGEAALLCAEVAPRAWQAHPELVTLQVVTGSYRLHRFFAGDRRPRAEELHAELHRAPGAAPAQEVADAAHA
jgi:hypothetical protein